MAQICTNYYKKLYTTRAPLESRPRSQKIVLRYLLGRLLETSKINLEAPLTLEELRAALFDIKLGKSLRHDGVVVEFYKSFWNLIGDDYLRMIHENISLGWLLAGLTQGMIALLHKRQAQYALTN